jgi:transcriptional regulator with XRE-family HTH domain
MAGARNLPTIRSRELGDGVRVAIRAAGLGVREVAHKLGWTHPFVSHVLNGKRSFRDEDLLSVLLVCGVDRDERARLLALSRESGVRGWLQHYSSGTPEQPRTLIEHERKATDIFEVQWAVLPKLLHTEGYARALLSQGTSASGAVEALVGARLGRQAVFTRSPPPRTVFFVHEPVLRAVIGGVDVMCDQVHHLLTMSIRRSLELRIVPSSAGHAAQAGSFSLMESGEFDPVVYLEGAVSVAFLEEPDQITAYRRVLSVLDKSALNRTESQELITALAGELSRRASPDVSPLDS